MSEPPVFSPRSANPHNLDYLAGLLKEGGYVIIDDLHIWTCETMVEFLQAEKGWSLVHESLSGAAFQKLSDASHHKEYVHQPFVVKRSREFSLSAKRRYMVNLLKRRNVRLSMSTLKLGVHSALLGRFGKRTTR